MDYFPIFIELRDQPVLVVGGGAIAERKIRLLLKSGAAVRVVARRLNPAVAAWRAQGRVTWLGEEFKRSQLAGAWLAYAATDDAQLNRRVHREAEALNIPVNVVDDRKHCRFITPAIVDRAPLQIAISSGGASPVLVRRLRSWLERGLPHGLGRIAKVAGGLRRKLQGLPLAQRRRAWDQVLSRDRLLAWSPHSESQVRRRMLAALERAAEAPVRGRVYLVGAGPGRPDLLTVRATQVLGQADVILHDRLVAPDILDLARRDAEFIDVGKRAGERHRTQERIHRIMLDHANRGRQVVRLKGGDAFVFGRGGEELEWLASHGIHYEVVPGITAATGCAAYTGIPLTHRDHAQVLSLVTGHVAAGTTAPDWGALAGPGRTLVVYMGLQQAGRLRSQLLDAGIAANLPAALVANGTRDDQHVNRGTVDELPSMAAATPPGAPALFILGEVASLGATLSWFEGQAVVGKAARKAA